ncbi:MAG: glycosyltransferase family 2 protein [Sediminibacterium sp.]
MFVSVVICSYNRAAYIGAALDSLYHQTASKDDFEVIVVDNNSSDGTDEVVKTWRSANPDGHFYYSTETKQGASFARNKGAALAKADWLCFMDDDAIATPDYIQNIIRHTQSHPTVLGFGGKIIPKYIPEEPRWMSYYVSSLVGNFDYAPIACAFENGKYPLESNMILKKSAFDLVGGFNEAIPGVVGTLRIGGEGKELFYKVIALGEKIYYDPSICVYHVVEVKKLTPEYMYRVASGIGRGERARTKAISQKAFLMKIAEYIIKLGAAVLLGFKYLFQLHPAKFWPIIQFRIDALKGLLNR